MPGTQLKGCTCSAHDRARAWLFRPERQPAAHIAVTLSRHEVLRLLEENRLSPSRALGQNFVADANTVRRIARLAGVGPGDRVVEIGAGLGSLTLALFETGACVTAVEVDRWLVPALRQVLAERLPAPCSGRGGRRHAPRLGRPAGTGLAAGCLWPTFPTTSPRPSWRTSSTGAGDRADARHGPARGGPPPGRRSVGDPSYGAVSVKVAYWAEAALVGTVPSSVFVPRPESRFRSRQHQAPARPCCRPPPSSRPRRCSAFVRTGFAQRRKMLRRALAGLNVPAAVFAEAGIDEESRAEELSVADWGRLAAAIVDFRGTQDQTQEAGERA